MAVSGLKNTDVEIGRKFVEYMPSSFGFKIMSLLRGFVVKLQIFWIMSLLRGNVAKGQILLEN